MSGSQLTNPLPLNIESFQSDLSGLTEMIRCPNAEGQSYTEFLTYVQIFNLKASKLLDLWVTRTVETDTDRPVR